MTGRHELSTIATHHLPERPWMIASQLSSAAQTTPADTVAHHVEQLIADGRLKPGQQLPSERQLGARLHVSRASLREGLRQLRGRGLIETRHGRGSFVSLLAPRHHEDTLGQLIHAHPRTLYDLLAVRALLEGEAARLAALHGSAADLVTIRHRFEALRDFSRHFNGDVARLAELDHGFHHAINEAAHNPVLTHTLNGLNSWLLTSVFTTLSHLYHRQAPRQRLQRQHARIYRALERQRPELARRAALDHLRGIRDDLQAIEREAGLSINPEH